MRAIRAVIGIFTLHLGLGCEAAAAENSSIRSLPVPASVIQAGEIIGAPQLTERRFQTTARSLAGVATVAEEAIGKEARRRLQAGKPIPLSALGEPLAVRRGAAAVASYEDNGISISTPVVVLEDGAAGAVVDARSAATGAVIKVEVRPDGNLAVTDE